jgi:hypothetical protein
VKKMFVEKATLGAGAIWDIEVWPDEGESFLLNADGTNNEVRILTRRVPVQTGSTSSNAR